MQVRSFKLINGQELIAEYVGVTSRGYNVRNPLLLHVLKDNEGKELLAFSKWSIVHKDDQTIELLDSLVGSAPVEIIDEVAESYVQQTSSLVISPKAASQILMG